MNAQQKVWVYGVVPAGATLQEVETRDRLPDVWVVEAGDLGAILGPAPENDEKGTRDQALAHARVLEAAAADAPVVPLRFGTVADSEEEVGTELLEARREALTQLLERIDDRVQMIVKAYYREQPILREILESEPEVAKLRDATKDGPEEAVHNARVRLGELVSAAIEQRRTHDSAEIAQRLEPVADAGVANDLEQELMVLNAPYLVQRKRLQEFEDAVEDLARQAGERMRFRLLGPMPAYDFLDQEEPAWAS